MGDVDAFEEIVMKYQKRMFNISYRMLGDYNEAAEAVQDAFVSVFRNIKGFRGESGLFTWISAIVVNMSRNRLRQMRKRAFREELSVDDPVDTDCGQIIKEPVSDDLSVLDKLEKREMQQKVEGCINGLDSEFREVIVLRDIQGFSYEEISDMLNIAVGTVKSRLHRARIAVKNCLRKFIGEL
jgi:RNA polymerase sigma-70 factor (ECF subfamily)